MSEPYDSLDKRFRGACKVLFGKDVGSLSKYEPWLIEHIEPVFHKKSALSGKPVSFAIRNFNHNARFISFDEIDFNKKNALDTEKITGISSILSQINDRLYYCGNIISGQSGQIEKSSNIDSSFYMSNCSRFYESKYCAFCNFGGVGSEDCFGCNGLGDSALCIKCPETYNYKRCFELWWSQSCSDCYYSIGLNNCSDCMFCFHLKNKRHCIGNVQLTPAECNEAKKRLLSQMAAELEKNGRLPSLVEISKNAKLDLSGIQLPPDDANDGENMAPILESFNQASKLVLGKELSGGLLAYEQWLLQKKRAIEKFPSALSKKTVYRGDYCNAALMPKDRLVKANEAFFLADKLKLSHEEAAASSFDSLKHILGKIAFFSPEYYAGTRSNIIQCPQAMDASNCYKAIATVFAKNCAIGMWPRHSEALFGFDAVKKSSFCINCYESVNIKRCFECDSCTSSSDCYFCHNAENCEECMFCFNAKGLRYAIGNVQLPKEEYLKIKKLVLAEIVAKLEKDKKLDLSIYNLGAGQAVD